MRTVITLALAGYATLATALPAGAAKMLTLPGFTVNVALSERAAAKVTGAGEGISVSAYYFGEPIDANDAAVNESGDISLEYQDVSVSAAGSASLPDVKVASKKVAKIKNRDPQVLINVFTSRKVFENNLLNCDIFQDSITVAAAKPIEITCKLIAE